MGKRGEGRLVTNQFGQSKIHARLNKIDQHMDWQQRQRPWMALAATTLHERKICWKKATIFYDCGTRHCDRLNSQFMKESSKLQ